MNQGYEYRERVGAGPPERTVLAYLSQRYRRASEAEWRKRIEAGQVLLDGMPAHPEDLLFAGQSLAWRRPPWAEPRAPLGFAVVYQDEHLLGVVKPSGLPTMPGGGFLSHTLLSLVRRRNPEAALLHRLNRATSGAVLLARTGLARRALAASWREGKVHKVYRALASGLPERNRFRIEVPIGRIPHPFLGSVHAATASGKPSFSEVRVVERRPGAFLAEIALPTGRPHQIRIHLAAAGHALVGDPFYGPGGVPREDTAALPGDSGYLLHSVRIGFLHPATGLSTEIVSPPPLSLRRAGLT